MVVPPQGQSEQSNKIVKAIAVSVMHRRKTKNTEWILRVLATSLGVVPAAIPAAAFELPRAGRAAEPRGSQQTDILEFARLTVTSTYIPIVRVRTRLPHQHNPRRKGIGADEMTLSFGYVVLKV